MAAETVIIAKIIWGSSSQGHSVNDLRRETAGLKKAKPFFPWTKELQWEPDTNCTLHCSLKRIFLFFFSNAEKKIRKRIKKKVQRWSDAEEKMQQSYLHFVVQILWVSFVWVTSPGMECRDVMACRPLHWQHCSARGVSSRRAFLSLSFKYTKFPPPPFWFSTFETQTQKIWSSISIHTFLLSLV